jgi:hypothetical protein
MNSINIQSTAPVSSQNKYKDFLKQNSQKTNIEDDNINVLPTESNKPEDDSIDHKLQEVPEDEKGIDLLPNKTLTSGIEDLSAAIDEAMDDEVITEEILVENPFPTHVFPSTFASIIVDLNKTMNYPEDYTGTALLTAMATTVGTSARIRVKGNWLEYASLYCCLIGNAGANKTHPINTVFAPIRHIDKSNNDVFVTDYKEYEEYSKLPKNEKSVNPIIAQPRLTKSVLTNFTPEALSKRLNENLRGCTVVSDEMATFLEGMNNYSKGDQLGVYLSFWSNQPTTIDRIGDPIPLFISKPYLSIIGGLQPRMIASVFPIKKLNNGFFQRFLFAFPSSTFKQPINDEECNKIILEKYEQFIQDYYSGTNLEEIVGEINSKTLDWTTEAKDFFYRWNKENCDLVNENQNSIRGEIISKYDNHFIRLALLLQLMEDPESNEIEIKAVKGAEELCNYYMNCAFKVLEIIQSSKEHLDTQPENKKNFYNRLNNETSTAEAILIGQEYGIAERSTKRFLMDQILFTKIRHGLYEKKLK